MVSLLLVPSCNHLHETGVLRVGWRIQNRMYDLIRDVFFFPLQASNELAATYAALILADDGMEITVIPFLSHFPEIAFPKEN